MPINYDEIDSNEESIKNLYNPDHPDGQAYLNSAKAKLDNHLKLIEQDPYHKVHAHPSNLANTISHYYGIVERQKNFKSNKGNLTPEHLLNINKLALNHADHHINRIRAQGMRTEGTMSKSQRIRQLFNNNIINESHELPFELPGAYSGRTFGARNPTLHGEGRKTLSHALLKRISDRLKRGIKSGQFTPGEAGREGRISAGSHARGSITAEKMKQAGIHGNAPATPKPTVVGSAEKLAGLAGNNKPVEGEEKWQGPKGVGDPIPWGSKVRRQDTSTNHARAGLKALFEELKNRRKPGDLNPIPRGSTRPPVPGDELKIHSADIASHIEGGATGPEAVAAEMPKIKSSANWHKMMGAESQKTTNQQLKDQHSYELALHQHADELATHPDEQNPFHDHGHHIKLGAELGYGPTQVRKHLIDTMTKLYNHHIIGMQTGEVPTTPRSKAYAARMINARNKLSGGPKLRTP